MQIALTKKLADAMNLKTLPDAWDENPILSWTANWTNTWQNRNRKTASWVSTAGLECAISIAMEYA